MEGVSGIDRESMTSFGSDDYRQGREFLTSDVNAAIRGPFAGGAGAVWVQDGHGSGNSVEPDILLDVMDPRARFDFRDYDYDPYSTGLDGSLDAIVCIGRVTAQPSAHEITSRCPLIPESIAPRGSK